MPLAKGEIDLWPCFPLRSLPLVHRTCNSWKNDFHGFPDSMMFLYRLIAIMEYNSANKRQRNEPFDPPTAWSSSHLVSQVLRKVCHDEIGRQFHWLVCCLLIFPNWRVQDKHYVTMLLLLSIQASLVWMNIPAQKKEDGVAAYMTCYCEGKKETGAKHTSHQVTKSLEVSFLLDLCRTHLHDYGISVISWTLLCCSLKSYPRLSQNSGYPKGNNREFAEKAKGKRRRDTDLSSPKNFLPTIDVAFPG